MSKSFEEDVLKAHTDQMNGDITPEEYVKRLKEIFESTVSFQQLGLQQQSNDNWVAHAETMEKVNTRQINALEKLVKLLAASIKTQGTDK